MADARAVLLGVLLLTVAFTGCLGGESETDGDEDLKRTAKVDERMGGIQGVVTDTAVQPVPGANVTLVEVNRTVTAAADGSYAFSTIQPGEYTLVVRAGGFVSTSEDVTVRAGEVSVVDFLITHLQSQEGFTETFELAGFFECGVEVGWNISALPPPADYFFLGWATCATLNIGENTTNDKFTHFFDLQAPLNTVVHEMVWDANGQFSEWMTVSMNVDGIDPNDGIGRFMRLQGPSPIQVRMENDTFDTLNQEFQEACEEGEDQYCGYNFYDRGWPLQVRVFPAWQCQSQSGGGCVVLQQSFTHFVTAFYNGPAPEGFTALEG